MPVLPADDVDDVRGGVGLVAGEGVHLGIPNQTARELPGDFPDPGTIALLDIYRMCYMSDDDSVATIRCRYGSTEADENEECARLSLSHYRPRGTFDVSQGTFSVFSHPNSSAEEIFLGGNLCDSL